MDNPGYLGCQPIPGPDRPPGFESSGDGSEVVVDLACDVALEDADDLFLRQAFFDAPFDIGAGARLGAHASDDDVPQRRVGLAVTAGVDRALEFMTLRSFIDL